MSDDLVRQEAERRCGEARGAGALPAVITAGRGEEPDHARGDAERGHAPVGEAVDHRHEQVMRPNDMVQVVVDPIVQYPLLAGRGLYRSLTKVPVWCRSATRWRSTGARWRGGRRAIRPFVAPRKGARGRATASTPAR